MAPQSVPGPDDVAPSGVAGVPVPFARPAAPADGPGLRAAGQPLGEEGSAHAEDYRALHRRRLGHEEYHAVVQARMSDLDALERAARRTGRDPLPGVGPGLVVALDVDGTLLDMDGRVSERVMASIARMRSHGVQVVVSTGRGIVAAMPVARHLGLNEGWMVCANGALTLRLDPQSPGGYEIVQSVTFDPAQAIDTLREAVPSGIIAVEVPGVGFRVSRHFPPGELIEDETVVSMEDLRAEPVTRVVLRAPGMGVEEFSRLVRGSGLHSVEYAVGWTAWLDVAPEGVTKASALESLTARLGLAASQVLAVGDGSNDVEMLQWAGTGVAMGSAPQWVRERADMVTEPVWREGCAAVLDALVERGRTQR